MIKVVKLVISNQNFIPCGYLPLPQDFVHVENSINLEMSSSLKPFAIFHQISHGAFCGSGTNNEFKWFCTIEQDGCHAHIHLEKS